MEEQEKAVTWHRKSPGRKSERAGFPKVLELFLTSATKYTYHNHNIITMKRKLNDQDVPEVAEAVTDVETEVEEKVERVEKKTPTAKTFAELGLDARLLQAINKEKFAAPTPVQARAIPLALSGKDILGKSFSASQYSGCKTNEKQREHEPALARQQHTSSPSFSPSYTANPHSPRQQNPLPL